MPTKNHSSLLPTDSKTRIPIDRDDRPGSKAPNKISSSTQVEERADKYLIRLPSVKGTFQIFSKDFAPPILEKKYPPSIAGIRPLFQDIHAAPPLNALP